MAKRVKGGRKLQRFIRKAKSAKGVRGVESGFYATAKYPDGTPVTNVAAWQEFGTVRIPERPFMRQSIPKMKPPLLDILNSEVDPHGWEYVAGVGPDDDPTLASTIRLFGSSEAPNWADHRLSPTDRGAEDTAERLWQHGGAFYRVLDPGWSDPPSKGSPGRYC